MEIPDNVIPNIVFTLLIYIMYDIQCVCILLKPAENTLDTHCMILHNVFSPCVFVLVCIFTPANTVHSPKHLPIRYQWYNKMQSIMKRKRMLLASSINEIVRSDMPFKQYWGSLCRETFVLWQGKKTTLRICFQQSYVKEAASSKHIKLYSWRAKVADILDAYD